MTSLNQYIDRIFYINLERRTDRRAEFEQQMREYGFSSNEYERLDAHYTPNLGIVGCGYSHLSVLKLAKARGYKNVLIFEDDFEFLVSPAEFRKRLAHFFETVGNNYDVCMMAYNLHESSPGPSDGIGKVGYAQTASAYIVNGAYFDTLISLYEWAIPELAITGKHWIYANDVIWRDLQVRDRWYFLDPRIGKQRAGFSDNAASFQDHGC